MFQDIKSWQTSSFTIKFMHTFQEANMAIDYMARKILSENFGLDNSSILDSQFNLILHADVYGTAYMCHP